MADHRVFFRLVYGLLAVLATVACCAFFGYIVLSATTDTTVQYVEKHDRQLDSKTSVSDTRGRFKGAPAQTINGPDMGLPAGSKCDAYELKDGLALLCYQGE